MLEKSYKIEKSPDSPIAWERYSALVLKEWRKLLSSEDANSEGRIQAFLEQHPCMLPGADGLMGDTSSDCPFRCAVISQPVLPSYEKRIPDFMWMAGNSMYNYPVLIEIESPTKKWFVRTRKQSEDLTQAIDQLKEWKMWFTKAHNVQAFKEFYRLPDDFIGRRILKPVYILIYGRREEATKEPHLAEKRSFLAGDDEFLMTFDRLAPNTKLENMMCVSVKKEGYRAISIPPTLKLFPHEAKCHSVIKGKAQAIKGTPLLSPARKRFLTRRFTYWDRWAAKKYNGFISLGDWE